MNTLRKRRLQAICSWIEVNAPIIASQLANVVDDSLNKAEDQQAILNEVKMTTQRRACNYLSAGVAETEEETPVGFAYCVRENERQTLLKEAVCEVKKNGLLKNALKELSQDDWPLSEDEKIVMLLSSPAEMPVPQKVVDGTLSIPETSGLSIREGGIRRSGKRKNLCLPVRVVISGRRIVNVLFPENQNNG